MNWEKYWAMAKIVDHGEDLEALSPDEFVAFMDEFLSLWREKEEIENYIEARNNKPFDLSWERVAIMREQSGTKKMESILNHYFETGEMRYDPPSKPDQKNKVGSILPRNGRGNLR